jgi:tetratricopeptide (TPR) repeat protein
MPRRNARFFFSLFLLAASSCFGQEPLTKVVSGYIREEGSGHVIGGARLELQNAMGTPIAYGYSDGNGAYEFDNTGGDCYLVVQHDGYTPAREYVRYDGAGHIYKDISLHPANSESKPNSINPVSERQLSIPSKARETFEKGVQLVIEKGDYRGAVAEFARAIAKYPPYYEAYAAMGLAQIKMGQSAAAEAAFRKSIQLSAEKYPQAMVDLASMFNGGKRFTEAEPLLRKAIALDASSWRGQFELATALAGQQHFQEAIASATAARDLKPENPQVYLLLYNLHVHADDFAAALRDTESYLKLTPDGATADRVRRMQEQIQKAVQSPGDPLRPSTDAAPSASPVPDATAAALSSTAPSGVAANAVAPAPPEAKPAAGSEASSVIPMRVDEMVPEVAVDVPCSLSAVLHGAGQRAEELLNTLQKFDAAERVEHYKLNAAGIPGAADVRSFDYVVSVSHDAKGGFQMQEYRNGGVAKAQEFPSGISTANLSGHGLIFHPLLAPGFHFACEGLGEWKGHSTWLVHFEEKKNDLNPFRSYDIEGVMYPLQLTGRAWIDAGTFQVLRLESDLLKPIEKIHLTREHINIEFASVQFHSGNQQLWLPQTADLYVEWNGHRFYRRHSFSNFKIFSTDATQEVRGPKNSYCFTNNTGLLITGILNATPVVGKAQPPPSLTLAIPAKGTVCASIGVGKDLDIPLDALASATFTHDGPAGSVEADDYLVNRSALEVISSTDRPANLRP